MVFCGSTCCSKHDTNSLEVLPAHAPARPGMQAPIAAVILSKARQASSDACDATDEAMTLSRQSVVGNWMYGEGREYQLRERGDFLEFEEHAAGNRGLATMVAINVFQVQIDGRDSGSLQLTFDPMLDRIVGEFTPEGGSEKLRTVAKRRQAVLWKVDKVIGSCSHIVRAKKDLSSEVVKYMRPGTLFRGLDLGDWVELVDDSGFAIKTWKGSLILRLVSEDRSTVHRNDAIRARDTDKPQRHTVSIIKESESLGVACNWHDNTTLLVTQVKPGPVSDHNAAHPGLEIAPGDRIEEVNDIRGDPQAMLLASREARRVDLVVLRCPEQTVRLRRRAGCRDLGFSCEPADSMTLRVTEIREDGLVSEHNRSRPSHSMRREDRIIAANDVRSDAQKLLDVLHSHAFLDLRVRHIWPEETTTEATSESPDDRQPANGAQQADSVEMRFNREISSADVVLFGQALDKVRQSSEALLYELGVAYRTVAMEDFREYLEERTQSRSSMSIWLQCTFLGMDEQSLRDAIRRGAFSRLLSG